MDAFIYFYGRLDCQLDEIEDELDEALTRIGGGNREWSWRIWKQYRYRDYR